MEALKSSLPELSKALATEGASTIAEAVFPSLCSSVIEASSDPVFNGINFEAYTAEAFVLHVSLQGSPIQRGALARYLKPEAGYALPGLWKLSRTPEGLKTSIKFIGQMIKSLAGHLGVQANGELDSVSYTIIQDYGGFSLADFLVFFERCKSGDFRQDFQHVASRGVNYEFLKTWLDAYAEERERCRAAAYSQYKTGKLLPGSEPPAPAPDFVTKMSDEREREKAYRVRVQGEADEIRRAWERQMVETIDVDGYPLQRAKPGAAARLLTRFLFEYVFFGEKGDTVSAVETLKEQARDKYSDTDDVEASVSAELKAITAELNSFKLATSSHDIAVRALLTKYPTGTAAAAAVSATTFLREMEAAYFKEYFPGCIEANYPALKAEEFVWRAAYLFYVSESNKNPLLEILNK